MTRNTACPNSMELTRRVLEDADCALREHLDACSVCAEEAAATRALVDLARELPDYVPSDESVEAVRHSLLVAGKNGISSDSKKWGKYRISVAAAAVVAFAVGLFLIVRSPLTGSGFVPLTGSENGPKEVHPQKVTADETRRAAVHAQKGADYVLLGPQPDEVIRLNQGTITVKVAKLRSGERFRVATGDAEVEVRGTAFDVTVKDDALVSVRVLSGKVEVRPTGREVDLLGPGEHWEATIERPGEGVCGGEREALQNSMLHKAVAPEHAGPGRTFPKRVLNGMGKGSTGTGTVRGAPTSLSEAAFNAGWDALKLGRSAEAAEQLGRAADIGKGESILEDAVFWRAVALDRAGARGPAADEMKNFLRRFPSSVRRGEVSVMLGYKLLANGDRGGAKALFESALKDPVPWVRGSAARGISESKR